MRHPGQLKTLKSLVNRSGSHLDTLRFEAQIQAERAKVVSDLLPEAYRNQISTGDLKLGLLTLYVPHSSLAAQLRFEEQAMLDSLGDHPLFKGIRRLKFRIRPPMKAAPERPLNRAASSAEGSAALQAYSDTLSDPELKRRFQLLAERVSGNRQDDQT